MRTLGTRYLVLVPLLAAGCVLGEWEVEGSYCDGDVLVAPCVPEEGEEDEDDCMAETDCTVTLGVGCTEREPGEAQCGQEDPGCDWYIHEFCYSEDVVGRCSGDLLGKLRECSAGEVCYGYVEYGTYYATCVPAA